MSILVLTGLPIHLPLLVNERCLSECEQTNEQQTGWQFIKGTSIRPIVQSHHYALLVYPHRQHQLHPRYHNRVNKAKEAATKMIC
jgi:hypothetical protein